MNTSDVITQPDASPRAQFSRRQALAVSGLAATTLALGGRVAVTQDAATPAPTGSGWDEVDRLATAVAPNATLLAAELIDGVCLPIHGLNADVVFPVCSTFKLWILGALAIEVEAGNITWEQPVEIQDSHRSVPGGDLRFALPGATFTVRYLAERMIQKSDNTATDHIFYLVGREKVEAAMVQMGHSDPALNIPIISTRELGLLKFGFSTEWLDDFFALPADERRRVLDEELVDISLDTLPDIDQTAPVELFRVEWFGTREDLCNAMSWLDQKSTEPGMLAVAEILALETQLPFDGETWPYAGFKGGSEFGALTGSWLLHRADGRHFVYSVAFMDPEGSIDMPAAAEAMAVGRDVLAVTP